MKHTPQGDNRFQLSNFIEHKNLYVDVIHIRLIDSSLLNLNLALYGCSPVYEIVVRFFSWLLSQCTIHLLWEGRRARDIDIDKEGETEREKGGGGVEKMLSFNVHRTRTQKTKRVEKNRKRETMRQKVC